MSELIIVSEQNALLVRVVSHHIILSAYVAYMLDLRAFVYTNLLIYFTTHLFWYRPSYGYRRTMDIMVVYSVFVFSLYNSLWCVYASIYYLQICSALLMYALSEYAYFLNKESLCIRLHCAFHIIANISNVTLYFGLEKPIDYYNEGIMIS